MDRPLRFAMVTTFYPPYCFGGDGIFVKRLSHELAVRGHHVTVIHNADAYRVLAGREPDGRYSEHANIEVHALRTGSPMLSLLASHQTGSPALYSSELRRLLSQDFDVIHFHNISLMGGPGVLALGDGLKLYTMHEYWLVCPTHVLFRFGRSACERRHCWTCSLSYRRPPQWWRSSGLMQAAVRHVDRFLSPSRFVAARHQEFGLNLPVTPLPNFVPCPSAPPQETVDPAVDPYFLFVGRLEPLKGIGELLPVFRRYPRARLLIAGAGQEEGSLRRLAAGCGNIEFLGHVSGTRIESLFRGAMALLLPSINYESCPLVALEALSHQTPVIAHNIGAMPELIEDSGGGFVYRTGTELVEAMDSLLDNPALRMSLGRAGQAAWERLWSPEVHMQRYLGLVRELLEGRAVRRTGPPDAPPCVASSGAAQ